jgi:hypothetical protein
MAFGALVVLIAFIVFRRDTALIQALSAFGAVAAAVFTALAAFAAMKAATESSHTAERAREALGRALKPTMNAWISHDPSDPDRAIGGVAPSADRGAADVVVTWHMRDGRTLAKDIGVLAPEPTGVNPHLPYEMDVGKWLGTDADTAEKVVIEYADLSKTARWRYAKRFMTVSEWVSAGHDSVHYDRRNMVFTDDLVG